MLIGGYTTNNRPRKPFSFAIFALLLASILTNVFLIANNGSQNLVMAQPSLSPSLSSNPISLSSSSSSMIKNQSISPGYSYLLGESENSSGQQQQQQQLLSLKDQSALNSSYNYQPTTREYTLIAENTTLEIAPGLRVDAWTYNGSMPGPTITAVEGDRVIVHFINKTPLPHTVHFHGDHPSEQDGVFEEIGPNGTYTYDFIAHPAGALGYHCHVPPVMQHVRMGLYGAFIVYPATPLPPAREYVFVDGEYDTQNQLNPLPEYYLFNGYVEQYQTHPLPAKTNETVRIYLINLGMSPAYGMHIHGTLFKAYPSGIWTNPPVDVQSWEIASGNTAILEAKWPWPGKFTFHFHGIPEERGAMGYFNVTNSTANDVDGKDVAINKSINMDSWQMNLTKSLQKQDPYGNITVISATETSNLEREGTPGHHGMNEGKEEAAIGENSANASTTSKNSSFANNSIQVSIVNGATTLKDKAYSPNPIEVKLGNTVVWTNDDSNMHTVTSGTPNSPDAGASFDSGITSLLTTSKTYSHKFTTVGEFDYFCRLHPTMVGEVKVVP
jgi:nitrite reductase (NO-forming)